jgi:hypothetical protein
VRGTRSHQRTCGAPLARFRFWGVSGCHPSGARLLSARGDQAPESARGQLRVRDTRGGMSSLVRLASSVLTPSAALMRSIAAETRWGHWRHRASCMAASTPTWHMPFCPALSRRRSSPFSVLHHLYQLSPLAHRAAPRGWVRADGWLGCPCAQSQPLPQPTTKTCRNRATWTRTHRRPRGRWYRGGCGFSMIT